MDYVNFRVKLAALRTAAREDERFVSFDSMLSQNLLVDGKMSTAAMFEAAYGDPRGRKYWELALSEWVSPRQLASLLGFHLDPPSPHKKGLFEFGILGALKAGIVTGAIAYRKAPADMEQNSEADDVTAGAFAEANRRNRERYRRPTGGWRDAYRIDPRRAAEWLLSAPMRERWVPETLRSYLRAPKVETMIPCPGRLHAGGALLSDAPVEQAPLLRDDLGTAYQNRRDSFLRKERRYPSRSEDRAWGQKQEPKVRYNRVDKLRSAHLPENIRKAGRGKNLSK